MTTKVAKKKSSQAQRDKLEIRKAKAILVLRKSKEDVEKAKQALKKYDRTH